MTVVWEGEGAEILTRIAAAQKMRFKITGPQPRLQLLVFVKLKDVSLSDAVQAIGEQFGQRADVVLTDDTIE
ncbi:DotD/TraH family lipoprotein, partial [Clostridium perfringens]